MYRNMCYASEDRKCISTFDDKQVWCQQKQKIYFKVEIYWLSLSHASEDTKCISKMLTGVMPAMTKNTSQLVLTKLTPCQRGHKMHLNICWPNPSYARDNTKCNSACIDQSLPIPARTQIVSLNCVDETSPMPERKQTASQHLLINTCHASNDKKVNLNLCRLNLSHASEDTKCISTFVDQIHPCLR